MKPGTHIHTRMAQVDPQRRAEWVDAALLRAAARDHALRIRSRPCDCPHPSAEHDMVEGCLHGWAVEREGCLCSGGPELEFTVIVGVALARPPRVDEYRKVLVLARDAGDARLVACQIAACRSVMPVSADVSAVHVPECPLFTGASEPETGAQSSYSTV